MLRFEEYLAQFTNTVSIQDFVIALLTTALLALGIRMYYIRFGDSLANRRRFANNFLPLALTTMLIITIVKSSIALSLGLVGALSIVRFRAAIKDPEELTYLFLVIGLGLASGAGQFVVALVAVPAILLILWAHRTFTNKGERRGHGQIYLTVETDFADMEKVSKSISEFVDYLELKRMDSSADGLSLTYVCVVSELEKLEQCRRVLMDLSPGTRISIIDRPDLVV